MLCSGYITQQWGFDMKVSKVLRLVARLDKACMAYLKRYGMTHESCVKVNELRAEWRAVMVDREYYSRY